MKSSKSILFALAVIAFALIGAALYLQLVEHMLPCPLCIMQRYAFLAVGVICLIAALLPPKAARIGAGFGLLAALAGAGVAIHHLWILAHPGMSCGIDPLETALNKIFSAKLLPVLFKADGMCTADYAPILGLSIPQWSLTWFVILAIALGYITFKRKR
ncbi:MAG: disulfide bond formation protein B [Proteobacteria bacterium]|nr:disulfide bond formation protein B [Pseudomonadota bacterium]